MLSVFTKPAQIYLSRRYLLVNTFGGPIITHAFSEDAEPEKALASIGAVEELRHRRLHFLLSGSHCPVVEIDHPSGVTSYLDRTNYARAICAQHFSVPTQEVDVEYAFDTPNIFAAIKLDLRAAVVGWATRMNSTVSRIQPLWSMASSSRLVRQRSIKGFVLQEPDSVTCVCENSSARSLRGLTLLSSTDQNESRTQTRRAVAALGLREGEQLATLGLANEAGEGGNTANLHSWPLCRLES